MKAVRIHQFGGPEVMRMEDIPVPRPGPGEILVRVCAASVNPVDYKTREGSFPSIALPIVLGRDISGIVERCGAGVQAFQPGDKIFAMLPFDYGGFAEYVCMNAELAAAKPMRLTHVEAAAVPLAALTAWQGLFDHGGLVEGQRLLIHGGAGGVGHFAIQFAKVASATVLTTVSAADLAFVRELGADEAIDYHTQHFEDVAKDMDFVFDLVGGEIRERSWPVLKRGGIMVSTLGQPSQETAAKYGARAIGYQTQPDARELTEIADLIDARRVRPVVAATYPFDHYTEAEQTQEERHPPGKIVLELAA